MRRILRLLGPGLITGAADDDPSGVGTYSIAGAQSGLTVLWTAWATWPLMAAVQMMCARIGMVTGEGLGAALRRRFPRPVVAVAAYALLAANTLNIGADLSAMADAARTVLPMDRHLWVILFSALICVATIYCPYQRIASVLKWLAVSLLAYIAAAFFAHPHWPQVWRRALVPTLGGGTQEWTTLVALLGTTISPYLFFWQTAQEVEEGKARSRRMKVHFPPATESRLVNRRIDVGVGTFASNLVMFFIILTCAETLHRSGHTQISTTAEAAAALAPIAGRAATALYTLGLVGVGLLAIPTLAGAGAYALADVHDWPTGLDAAPVRARWFYVVLIGTMAVGTAVDFVGLNPVRALFLSAVVNGLLSPFLLCGILVVAADKKIMKGNRSSAASFVLVVLATLAMFGAAVGMWWG